MEEIIRLSFGLVNEAVTENNSLRDHAQYTTNHAISLVVNNVISLLIGPPAWAPLVSIMYHVGEGTRPHSFPVTENGHGRVTEPEGDHFSGRNLGMIPKQNPDKILPTFVRLKYIMDR